MSAPTTTYPARSAPTNGEAPRCVPDRDAP